MDLMMQRGPSGLVPVDEESRAALAKMPRDAVLKVAVTRPRNVRFHRKFFALLTLVRFHMSEEAERRWPTTERLLLELKLQTGHFEPHVTLGGKTTYIPKSISFAQMDEDAFGRFYEDCLRILVKHVIPGVVPEALREAVEQEIATF